MTQRILFIEPVGGIAGDMFLSAALDLGVSLSELEKVLHSLQLPSWSFRVSRAERHGLFGTRVEVLVAEPPGGHSHRRLADIEALIHRSQLSASAQAKAVRVFRLLADVEAKIHGTSVAEVHFHEVGAVDSIVDICGAVVALELLGNPVVHALPPPVGGGSIRIAHGVVPVPVPATLALLQGVPIRFEGEGELTTPTGAALLKAFAHFGAPKEMVVERIGYGVGTKDWADRANVVRLSLGVVEHAPSSREEQVEVVECNLDDCSPQFLGSVIDALLAAGALDAWLTPVVMKKGRPGHVVSALVLSPARAKVTEVLFQETTTLGVRVHTVGRRMLQRRFETVETPWGAVRIKVGHDGARLLNAAPEFEECRALAAKAGVSVKDVHGAAVAAYWTLKREP